jgi:hypothetical protein
MTEDLTFNQTAYDELGHPYVGTQVLWNMFFDYASYTSAIVWMALFGYSQIKESLAKLWERRKRGSSEISGQFDDQLSILQRAYPEVPLWWFAALFLCSFVILVTIIASGHMFIPVWTYFVAIATGAVIVVPLGWLYALSNFQLVRVLRGCKIQLQARADSATGHWNDERAAIWPDGQRRLGLQEPGGCLVLRLHRWRRVVPSPA